MEWSDFAAPSGGFTRTNPVLDVSLSFASPLSSSIQEWPKERDDLNRRLHKSQKEATPFHYDTKPHIGVDVQDGNVRADHHGRVYIEEAFVDWWADWAIGGAWADREELTFKEANWAIVSRRVLGSRNVAHSRSNTKLDQADRKISQVVIHSQILVRPTYTSFSRKKSHWNTKSPLPIRKRKKPSRQCSVLVRNEELPGPSTRAASPAVAVTPMAGKNPTLIECFIEKRRKR